MLSGQAKGTVVDRLLEAHRQIGADSGIALTAGLGVGAFGAFEGRPVGSLVSSTVINSGLVAATFFTVREYAISPLLLSNSPLKQHETRRAIGDATTQGTTRPSLSWSDLRTYNLLDSSISGAITGGVMNSIKRGLAGLSPGILTGAFACTLIQWSINELGIARVKFVSCTPQSYTTARTSAPSTTSQTQSVRVDPDKSLSTKLLSALGFHRMTDAELLVKFRLQREQALRRIDVLEREMEAEAGRSEEKS